MVEKLKIPILVHPSEAPGVNRMPAYYLQNILGYPLDTSIEAASILFGGILEKFPDVKFCFAHGGGFIPYQKGRLARGFEVRNEPKQRISRGFDEYLALMYFDAVLLFEPALVYLVAVCGSDRVMMGSDYPFDLRDPNPTKFVTNSRLKQEDKKMILCENALRLFKGE